MNPTNDHEQSSGIEAVKTRLKWFNIPKGFGFVVPEGESLDAFLHITTLQKAGISELGEGACLLCHIDRGPKGAQVVQVVSLLDIGVQPESIKALPHKSGAGAPRCSGPFVDVIEGAIKWYKPEKGFGFVTPDDGSKDIFIHKSCLDKKGLSDLETGLRVRITVKEAAKGLEVTDFDIL